MVVQCYSSLDMMSSHLSNPISKPTLLKFGSSTSHLATSKAPLVAWVLRIGGGGRSKRQRGVVGRGAQWAQWAPWAPGRVEERSEALIKSTCQARSGAFARALSLSL